MNGVPRPRFWPGRVRYRLLSLIFSGALLSAGTAIVHYRLDWHNIAAVWLGLNPTLVAFATLVYWLAYPINSYRLHRVILWATERPLSEVPPIRFLFKLTCSAGFVAVVAPIGLVGDVTKIAALRVFGSLSITEAARCALFDRVVSVQWFCMFGLAILPLQAAAGIDREIILAQFAIFAGLLAGIGVLLVLPRTMALARHDLIDKVARVFAGYQSLLLPRKSGVQLIFALLNMLCSWGTLYLLLRAAELNTNAWLIAGFVPILQLVNSLPFLYMGWGGREIAMAATLGVASDLTVNETLAISIAWGLVLIVTGAVNGLFLLGDWRTTGRSRSGDG